ncbi:MAG TPA: PQQ-binding-like beta-propeller repeat protein [Planctomycetaceae bacterium]|nr:PQQ-binding-like beta-propeller repeat protein [Planctomycetaceae bacterium]
MSSFVLRLIVPTLVCLATIGAFAAEIPTSVVSIDSEGQSSNHDWPWWRGPWRTGEANPNQNPPTSWSKTENILWKSPIPGRGHSSPIVVGESIYLATSDESTGSQSLMCYDRTTGKKVWQTVVHESGGMMKNKKATMASSTAAFDGERLFINFPNNGALYTTALSPEGDILWQTKISDYVVHQGYGSSPAIYKHLVIVAADNKGGGAIAGLDRKTGNIVWKQPRPKLPNYPSPVILNVAGQDQMLMTGCKLVTSFDPLTGEKNWEVDGATEECVTSTVTDGTHIFSSGGYPKNHIAAIRADGSKKIDWEIGDRVYVPSFVIRGTNLFGVMDAGVAACWNSETGEELWKARLGGNFTASLVLVGDLIYATNEDGTTFLYKADPAKFDRVAVNKLGDEAFATPTICGGRIYMRVTERDGEARQEYLYCIGQSDK